MQDVSVQEIDGYVYLVSPYNESVPPKAKRIGGKWDRERRAWRFDTRDSERVKQLAADVFGWTDGDVDTVTIRIKAESYVDRERDDRVVVAGRTVARRRYRDGDVELSPNVVIVEGRFADRGGSVRQPAIGDSDDPAILEIRDIPRSMLSKLNPDRYELVGDSPVVALKAERQRLLDRLAELDKLIGEAERR